MAGRAGLLVLMLALVTSGTQAHRSLLQGEHLCCKVIGGELARSPPLSCHLGYRWMS